ncbi:DgyrCDS14650 [Dimorphilus gyrociliatus]|uniref:DgyrCDS14650 n=1 Tax=Dimorphilus gyrociliatus TaxID=2664684 RepID=A0A7I8WEE8_9ANNE|nr:DgyrCDS14650 [Dimorphilus gyrociliatus]
MHFKNSAKKPEKLTGELKIFRYNVPATVVMSKCKPRVRTVNLACPVNFTELEQCTFEEIQDSMHPQTQITCYLTKRQIDDCPEDYITYDEKCYKIVLPLDIEKFFGTFQIDVSQAFQLCNRFNMTLLTISSLAQRQILTDLRLIVTYSAKNVYLNQDRIQRKIAPLMNQVLKKNYQSKRCLVYTFFLKFVEYDCETKTNYKFTHFLCETTLINSERNNVQLWYSRLFIDKTQKCPNWLFTCQSSKYCINYLNVCDGSYECWDKSDENNCQKANFTFKCNDKTELQLNFVCNYIKDCPDGSDEWYCGNYECKNNQFIPKEQLCNNDKNCIDGSDEGEICREKCRTHYCNNNCLDEKDKCFLKTDCHLENKTEVYVKDCIERG